MSWGVGTVRAPDGTVHIWYVQAIGTFEEDMLVCRPPGAPGGFIPDERMNASGGWRYCDERVTCEACKGGTRR